MTCPNCGATVAENRRFCGKCGTALAETSGPADAPTAPPPPPPQPPGPMSPPSSWGPPAAPAPQWQPPTPMPPSAPTGTQDPFAPPNLGPPSSQQPWAGYGAPPQYPPPGYAGPPPQYPPGQYPPGAPGGWPGYGYGYGYAPPHTNGLAIASFVLGLGGWLLCGVGSVVAIVLGFVSRHQIKQSWGRQTGSGFATAGIVLGFIGASFWIVALILNLVHTVGSTG
jgi:hypothetical protein